MSFGSSQELKQEEGGGMAALELTRGTERVTKDREPDEGGEQTG